MHDDKPRLSIGLPVFNGENYLEKALESLLAQTFSDFQLIISDNASTDRTPEICQAFAARDRRICYYRNEKNIGVSQNFYRVLELSSGEYFKWAAHDDLHAPQFLERCVQVLDQDSSVVLCYPRTIFIDKDGTFIKSFDVTIDTTSPKPHERIYNIINVDYWTLQIYGVIRAKVLKEARFYTGFYGWDWNVLAELSLWGKVYEVPEYLFYRRDHPLKSGGLYSRSSLTQMKIFDPTVNWNSKFPGVTKFRGYFLAVTRAPLSQFEKLMCYLQLIRLAVEKSVNRLRKFLSLLINPNHG